MALSALQKQQAKILTIHYTFRIRNNKLEYILVNTICSSLTVMPAVGALGPELPYFLGQGMHRTATKRFAQPEKIANGITSLSSMSSFMSGEAILGDG